MISALSIAGSDSSGGAGIIADMKSFASIGVHGCAVVTCITAQNTKVVEAIFSLPPALVKSQIQAVLGDVEIRAAKIGMLYSEEIADVVADRLEGVSFPIVVDPILLATVGQKLHKENLVGALRKRIIPLSTLVMPNIHEAQVLANVTIRDENDVALACKKLRDLGARNVLIKGGHLKERATDFFYDGNEVIQYEGYRFEKELHGSGCLLSTLVAGYLALGLELRDAIQKAKKRVSIGFKESYSVGSGVHIINSCHFPQEYKVWSALRSASIELCRFLPKDLVPEVGINFAYALPFAESLEEVCALSRRIVREGDGVSSPGCPEFGASTHVARIILTAMRFNPLMMSAANLKYDERMIKRCDEMGLSVGHFRREYEPGGVSSMTWGTEQAISEKGEVPDIICDKGEVGKEPMCRILGTDPSDVLSKIRKISRGMG